MKEAKFTIPGEPKPKGRPRFSVRKGKDGKSFISTRTPEETVIYENLVRLEYERQCSGIFFEKGTPIEMEIRAYFAIPQSTSKKKAKMMQEEEMLPLKRPDLDNLIKIIADSCNGVAYHDDAQIVDMRAMKFYAEAPRLEATIREKMTKGECNAQ